MDSKKEESRLFSQELDVELVQGVSGFPSAWLEENKLTSFSCNICTEIVRTPASLTCGHLFCKECLQKAAEQSRKCPLKCEVKLPSGPLEENVALTRVLSQFEVSCVFRTRGCPSKPALGVGCAGIMEHIKNCGHRILVCEQCHSHVYLRNKSRHDLEECEKRRRPCLVCHDQIPWAEWKDHMIERAEPALTEASCPWSAFPPALAPSPLIGTSCSKTRLCPQGCKIQGTSLPVEGLLLEKNVQLHLKKECPETEKQCTHCGGKFLRKNQEQHFRDSKLGQTHVDSLLSERRKLKKQVQELQGQLKGWQGKAEKRKAFVMERDEEVEQKFTKLMEDGTRIFVKDSIGEWAEAVIAEILPFNNVRIRFTQFDGSWDLVVNTVTQEHLFALDKDSIPPMVNEPMMDHKGVGTSHSFKKGQAVWAASLYNGAQGSNLIKGVVTDERNGQVKVEADSDWQRRDPRGSSKRWFHVMEVFPLSTNPWKTKEARTLPEPPRSASEDGEDEEGGHPGRDIMEMLLRRGLPGLRRATVEIARRDRS